MYNIKLERKVQKIFGSESTAQQMTAFGTPATGTPEYTKDIDAIQNEHYEAGWFPAVLNGNIRPYAEDRNAVDYEFSRQIAYILQSGVPEWNAETPYFTNDICRVGGDLYKSLTDNNIGNAPNPSGANSAWALLSFGSDDYMPVGASIEWNSNVLPSGKWHFEDGSYLNIADYPLLYSRIGTTYGGNGTTNFRLPDSRGRFVLGYTQTGIPPKTGGGYLGATGGTLNHTHTIKGHFHGMGSISISSGGSHVHQVTDPGHLHNISAHQHAFRFGDRSAKQDNSGQGINTACLGSQGLSGTDANPTRVSWNRGNAGDNTGHFYKVTTKAIPFGGTMSETGDQIANATRTGVTIRTATHSHNSSEFSGFIGNNSSTSNGDADNQCGTSNPPYIVKRKIIRILP